MLQLLAPFIRSRIMWRNESKKGSHGLKCSVYIKNNFLSVFVHINVQGFNEGFFVVTENTIFFPRYDIHTRVGPRKKVNAVCI